MMSEKNYDKLRDALDKLPEYGAPAGAWEGIERGLTPPLAERLPSYRPPAEVWNEISRQMATLSEGPAVRAAGGVVPRAQSNPRAQSPATIRRLWPKLAGIAATLALLIAVGVGMLRGYDPGPTITYAFSKEPAPAAIVADWGDDEDRFAAITAEIEARNTPTLNNLGHELEELTAASQEVQAMLVAYGDDPKVVRQLAEIERDRSDIYRRIIAEI